MLALNTEEENEEKMLEVFAKTFKVSEFETFWRSEEVGRRKKSAQCCAGISWTGFALWRFELYQDSKD